MLLQNAVFAVAVAESHLVAALTAVAVAEGLALAAVAARPVGCTTVAGTVAGTIAGIFGCIAVGIVGMFVPVVVVVAGELLGIGSCWMLVAGVVVGMLVHKLVGMLVHKFVGMFVAVVVGSVGSVGSAVVVIEAGMALMSLLQSFSPASCTLIGPVH